MMVAAVVAAAVDAEVAAERIFLLRPKPQRRALLLRISPLLA